MKKSRGLLSGVQFISYAKLASDVLQWSRTFPRDYYRGILGVPRSGLTCGHMLSVHLNTPCTALNAKPFRQSSGRRINSGKGPFLVIDDTASYGTTMREVKSQMSGIPSEFAVVYARKEIAPTLDHSYAEHKEPDWLVITEWNWYRHQDVEYIAITKDVISLGIEVNHEFDNVYESNSEAAAKYKNSLAAVLFAIEDCQSIADECSKPVIDAITMHVHQPGDLSCKKIKF